MSKTTTKCDKCDGAMWVDSEFMGTRPCDCLIARVRDSKEVSDLAIAIDMAGNWLHMAPPGVGMDGIYRLSMSDWDKPSGGELFAVTLPGAECPTVFETESEDTLSTGLRRVLLETSALLMASANRYPAIGQSTLT